MTVTCKKTDWRLKRYNSVFRPNLNGFIWDSEMDIRHMFRYYSYVQYKEHISALCECISDILWMLCDEIQPRMISDSLRRSCLFNKYLFQTNWTSNYDKERACEIRNVGRRCRWPLYVIKGMYISLRLAATARYFYLLVESSSLHFLFQLDCPRLST